MSFAQNVQSKITQMISDPMKAIELLKLKDGVVAGLWVATKFPGLIGEAFDTGSKIISYGDKNVWT
jgi:hypothetical protein